MLAMLSLPYTGYADAILCWCFILAYSDSNTVYTFSSVAKCSQRLPQFDLIVVTASDEGYISELLFLTHLTPAIEDREPRSD